MCVCVCVCIHIYIHTYVSLKVRRVTTKVSATKRPIQQQQLTRLQRPWRVTTYE